ncbi:Aldo-keto reductase family 1 member A1 [Frankliniella fusca]|uniref:Aldo-keto reductase family 1 member A1 n=1 Tax=Frankliniella fusca TaxID=407009 RepID=A0AAE1HRT1_9NEOP|nr:Aldo-keto reductase family 1 member A1 [Frankliniella fusca]
MACPEYATLHNGAKMPLLGYGTWQSKEGELEEALEEALCAGYRHIDTAAAYENEGVIGKLIKEGWIDTGNMTREELFIVTKLPPPGVRPGGPEKWLKRSLEHLQMDYVDVYLVHVPFAFEVDGDNLHPRGPDGKPIVSPDVDHIAVWREMEAQVDAGRAKAIGLSNFNQRQIQEILKVCRIKPANLQVELHVYMQQRPLVDFCTKNGIVVTAYSPLGTPGSGSFFSKMGLSVNVPSLLSNPVVVKVADKHNKQPGQILLKHIVQRGIVAIPKSSKQERIIQNIQLFDFTLSPEDMAELDALDQGKNGRIIDFQFLGITKDHVAYPFNEYP